MTLKVPSDVNILSFWSFFPGHGKSSHFSLLPWFSLLASQLHGYKYPTPTCRLQIAWGSGILWTQLPHCDPFAGPPGLRDFLPGPNASGLEFHFLPFHSREEVRPWKKSTISTPYLPSALFTPTTCLLGRSVSARCQLERLTHPPGHLLQTTAKLSDPIYPPAGLLPHSALVWQPSPALAGQPNLAHSRVLSYEPWPGPVTDMAADIDRRIWFCFSYFWEERIFPLEVNHLYLLHT